MKRMLIALGLTVLSSSFAIAGKRIAVIVDTSGSMDTNDRKRYAAQIAKILSDLTDDDDYLSVIRMPSQAQAMPQDPLTIIGGLLRRTQVENCTPGPVRDLSI